MLQVIRANNPGPLTGPGTNTFLIGRDEIAVIDPGPEDPGHCRAIIAATRGAPITAILVTHAHRDHSAGAAALAAATGAPVHAYGPATAGRSPLMARLAAGGLVGGGEGIDDDFIPDRQLEDGAVIAGHGWRLTAIWTPGHSASHLAYRWNDVLFVGDIVLGWSSTLISPPDGDLADYMRSLERIASLKSARLYPAHGDPIDDPAARLDALARHRRERTAEILAALATGPASPGELAARIYTIPAKMLPAAARNVLAHLLALETLGVVRREPAAAPDPRFHLATRPD